MKIKFLYLIALVLFFSNCSKDKVETPALFKAESIEFIYQDGQAIIENDCLNFDDKYAIKIVVKKIGGGYSLPTQISYTLNGELMNVTVQNEGVLTVNALVLNGANTVLVLNTNLLSTINIVKQEDFVLVK